MLAFCPLRVVLTHRAGETRVLVDALYGDGLKGYPTVPPAARY